MTISSLNRLIETFNKRYWCYLILPLLFIPVLSVLFSVLLYIAADPSFSIFTHYLSDLGAGPNGAALAYNVGMILSSFVLILFYLQLGGFMLKKESSQILVLMLLISGFVSAIGFFFVAIFPLAYYSDLHNFFASFIFLGGLSYSIIFGITTFKTPNISNVLGILSFVATFFYIFFLTYNTISFYFPELLQEISHFSEWLLSYTTIILLFTLEIYMCVKLKK